MAAEREGADVGRQAKQWPQTASCAAGDCSSNDVAKNKATGEVGSASFVLSSASNFSTIWAAPLELPLHSV